MEVRLLNVRQVIIVFGFRVNNFLGREYIKHSGGYPGCVSEFIYYPKENGTIILLKNTGNYGRRRMAYYDGIVKYYFRDSLMTCGRSGLHIKLTDDILKQKEGNILYG
jgi:hypothetical protein